MISIHPITFFSNIVAAAKRLFWLHVVLIPILAVLAVAITFEVLSTIHRVFDFHAKKSNTARVASRIFQPTDPGAWLSWALSSFIRNRLHANIPLVALSARWVSTRCPHIRPRFANKIWAALREEESFGLGSRSGGRMPADKETLEHVYSHLEKAFGFRWQQAIRLDPVAISNDCIVESYNAVLREDSLAASQQERRSEVRSSYLWCCKRRRQTNFQAPPPIAETALARRAVVRVRRKDVAEKCFVDLFILQSLFTVFSLLGFCSSRIRMMWNEFVNFVNDQLDLRNEARLFSLCQSALPRGIRDDANDSSHTGIVCPKLYGEAAAEVLIVSYEDGVCMSEVLQRRNAHQVDDADAVARAEAARALAKSFWEAAFNDGLLLAGLSTNSLLLRTAGCEHDLEVVILRCGLTQEIDAQTQEDLRAFAESLARGPGESIGPLILERVHSPAGGAFGAVQGLDAFSAGVRELLSLAHAQIGVRSPTRSNPSMASQPPLRGDALLQRAMELALKHDVCVGPRHLQLGAAVAAIHGVCARLDPHSAGRLLWELQVAAGVTANAIPPQ